jgi:lipopolysaccharide export system protein LptA
MRALLLCLCLAVGAMAQQKDVSFRQVVGGSFAGFSEDEKAEKIWEATAKFMRPSAEAGVWEMETVKVQSLRGGKPWAVFTSPQGTMAPAKRTAQGTGAVQSSSPAFNLTGRGWNWRSTPKGDSFSILADVAAELDLAKPLSRRLRLRAPRMDATPVDGGTLMVFQGGVVAERFGERTTCERLECLVSDGPGGDATCRSVVASGRVVRVLDRQTLRGDRATFDPKDESAELIGQVELEEPEVKASAQRLRHQPKLGLTQLFAGDGKQVRLRLQRKQQEPADLAGELVSIRRDVATGDSQVEVQDNASFLSALSNLTARRLVASEGRDGSSVLVAEGGVKGRLEGNQFEAGKARWDRAKRVLDLQELPRIREARGLEAAGFSIRTDALKDRIEIRSAPGLRAAVRLPPGEPGAAPGLAEADQIVVVTEDGAMQVELLGAVRYVAGAVTTESAQMVAFATPHPQKKSEYELSKAILSGRVRYAQPGLRCAAERIDLTPAVQIEEVLTKDALAGRPRLLTMSGGAGATRPHLFLTSTGGKNVEFVADAHEVLTTPELTKFFLRGAVAMQTEGTDASCDLLEGMASPDKAGHLVARQVVGRGNVVVVAGGSTAKGRTLEMQPEKGSARLQGDARIVDKLGNEGVPAKEITYDIRTRAWRMDSAPDEANPGQVVRPKIFLGRDFTLPEVKNLDNGR